MTGPVLTTATLAIVSILTVGITAGNQPAQPRAKAASPVPERAALLKQAAEAQQAGRNDEAVRLLQLAAERYQSVQAYLELARLQSRTKQSAAALDSLLKARALAPNSEDVLSAYAQLTLAVKQPMPAVLTLQSLTRMCPSVSQDHYLLGVGLMAIGDMPSAVEALTEADRLEPERRVDAPCTRSGLEQPQALCRSQDRARAQPRAATREHRSVAALAEAESGLGNFDAAAGHAERALQRSPASATANLVMGLVLIERRNYAGAQEALLKAMSADPDSPKAVYQLSLVEARLGDEAAARATSASIRKSCAQSKNESRCCAPAGRSRRGPESPPEPPGARKGGIDTGRIGLHHNRPGVDVSPARSRPHRTTCCSATSPAPQV